MTYTQPVPSGQALLRRKSVVIPALVAAALLAIPASSQAARTRRPRPPAP